MTDCITFGKTTDFSVCIKYEIYPKMKNRDEKKGEKNTKLNADRRSFLELYCTQCFGFPFNKQLICGQT